MPDVFFQFLGKCCEVVFGAIETIRASCGGTPSPLLVVEVFQQSFADGLFEDRAVEGLTGWIVLDAVHCAIEFGLPEYFQFVRGQPP